jgi:nicotinamidase/pyrazinamidase
MGKARKQLVFVDVDTQRDFMEPGGALYVPGASEIVENLRRLTDFARKNQIPIIATADAHTPEDPEFDSFPPHCVKGSSGQQRIEATAVEGAAVIGDEQTDPAVADKLRTAGAVVIEKRTYDAFTNPNMGKLIDSLGEANYIVYGVATDYCVKKAVEGLLRMNRPVAIVVDAVRAVDPAAGRKVLDELAARGATLTTTDAVCSEPH